MININGYIHTLIYIDSYWYYACRFVQDYPSPGCFSFHFGSSSEFRVTFAPCYIPLCKITYWSHLFRKTNIDIHVLQTYTKKSVYHNFPVYLDNSVWWKDLCMITLHKNETGKYEHTKGCLLLYYLSYYMQHYISHIFYSYPT